MNHQISLQTAIDMTTLFRENQPTGMPLCETFERQAIDRLLSTPGCARLRIYYGMKNGSQVSAILVAADAENNDLLPSAASQPAGGVEEPVIVDDSFRCPPACPPGSPLNPKKP